MAAVLTADDEMTSEIINEVARLNDLLSALPNEKTVIFSFQGAFGPPSLGHYTAMKLYARQVLINYPDTNILMLFMPTALGSSKPHLEPTQNLRLDMLSVFCNQLNSEGEFEGQSIVFDVSTIEYLLCKGKNRDTATYRTLAALNKIRLRTPLLLGMGLDNMLQFPYWKKVEEYNTVYGVEKIYVASRELTDAEKSKTRKFQHDGKGAILNFDITVPTWANVQQAKKAFGVMGNNAGELSDALLAQMPDTDTDRDQIYTYNLELPELVIVGDKGEKIPGTSSSMIRYYICKYIKAADAYTKEKIRRLIWGDKTTDAGVEETITDYNKLFNTDSACPPDNNYDNSFLEIFSAEATAGGKRKSRRNRKSKKSRKNHRKSARRRRR